MLVVRPASFKPILNSRNKTRCQYEVCTIKTRMKCIPFTVPTKASFVLSSTSLYL